MRQRKNAFCGVMQRGFSLVEILVSVLVLSIGVIGAAGMQLTAVRMAQQSAFQTAAVELAAELADKMRANNMLLEQGGSNNPFVDMDYHTSTETPIPPVLCYGISANCGPEQLAQLDLYEWQQRMKRTLPVARAVVCRDAAPWDVAANAFQWHCRNAAEGHGALVIKIGWQSRSPDGGQVRDQQDGFSPHLAMTVSP